MPRTITRIKELGQLFPAGDKGSAHIDPDRVAEVLRTYPHLLGRIDLGDVPIKTMYRLASHAMHLVLIDEDVDAPNPSGFEELVKIARTSTLSMVEALDYVIFIYIRQR